VTAATLRQLSRIALALLGTTEHVTMLGLSRWAGKGDRYRIVQRWDTTVLPRAPLFRGFFRPQRYYPDEVSLKAGPWIPGETTPRQKKCRSLDPFAALKRNPSKARSPHVHRFMESPYGKNHNAGGSYAHEPS